jgi:hypothetical protein
MASVNREEVGGGDGSRGGDGSGSVLDAEAHGEPGAARIERLRRGCRSGPDREVDDRVRDEEDPGEPLHGVLSARRRTAVRRLRL